MNIGIIGSGNVGWTLGERWAKFGHHVVFGTRDPREKDMQDVVQRSGETAQAASFERAAEADVVVLALPWAVAKSVIEKLNLSGKIVLDCMNPLKPDLSGLEFGMTTSGAEQVAHWA